MLHAYFTSSLPTVVIAGILDSPPRRLYPMHCLMTNDICVLVSMEDVSLEMSLDTCFIRMLMATANRFVSLVCLALILERGAVVVFGSIDGFRLLQELKTHTAIGMPDQVTMHEPGTWIVGFESNDGPPRNESLRGPSTEKEDSIAADWVVKTQLANHVTGEDASSLSQDGEIVSVKMHGVRGLEIVLDHKVNPVVGRAIEDGSVAVQGAVVSQAG